jgi:hypothetical protein
LSRDKIAILKKRLARMPSKNTTENRFYEVHVMVARWFIFKLKSFGGKMLIYYIAIWNILRTFDTLCVHLVHIFPVLVSCTKKNLATLVYVVLQYELPWRRGLVISSPPATEETGAVGREIESLHGIGW